MTQKRLYKCYLINISFKKYILKYSGRTFFDKLDLMAMKEYLRLRLLFVSSIIDMFLP